MGGPQGSEGTGGPQGSEGTGGAKRGETTKTEIRAKTKKIGIPLPATVAAMSRTMCKKPIEYLLAAGPEKALNLSTSIIYMKHY
jgi:hypothetical protein